MASELTTIEAKTTDLVALFKSGADQIDPLLSRIEAEVRAHAPDTTTNKGREAIASLAYKVSRSKTALDGAGKSLTDEARKEISAVDAARKKIRDRLDALRDEARAPLDAWEAAEAARKARIDAAMASMRNHGMTGENTSSEIRDAANELRAVPVDETFAEFQTQAEELREATLQGLRSLYAAAKAREDQQAELEALRAEKMAREAAEEAARAERDRVEAERQAEELAAQRAREVEAARKADAERIEREKAEAVAKAAAQAEERHAREMADAKQREEQAAQRERDRIAAEAEREAAARAKREADLKHRARIKAAIVAALDSADGERIADALMNGAIPHCKVEI